MNNLLKLLTEKKKTDRRPVWFMRQAGRYLPEYKKIRAKYNNFIEFIKSPQDAATVTLQPVQRFDIDAAIIFSDILLVPHALGQKVEFIEGEGPQLAPVESLAQLSLKEFERGITPTLEAIALVKARMHKEVDLIGFAGSPWTVLTYMIEGKSSRDFIKTTSFYYKDPILFRELLALVEQATEIYLGSQIKAGADILQLFDSWAGGVPQGLFEELVLKPHQRLVANLKKNYPHVPLIAFPRGIGDKMQRFVESCSIDALSLDTMTTPLKIKNVVVQGGIDPAVLLAGGDAMIGMIREYLNFYQDVPYVVNLGHGINLNTPITHVEDFIRYVRTFDGRV